MKGRVMEQFLRKTTRLLLTQKHASLTKRVAEARKSHSPVAHLQRDLERVTTKIVQMGDPDDIEF